MRGMLRILLFLAAVTVSVTGEGEFRVFTSADDRIIEARILEHNSSRNKIQIERINGKKIWIELGIFSEKDRKYIHEWIQASEFLSNSKVRISVNKYKKSEGKAGDYVHYSIKIQNRTKSDLNDLILDYRFYVEGNGYNKHRVDDRCIKGQLVLDTLPAGGTKSLETRPELMVEMYDVDTESYTDEYGNISFDSVIKKMRDDDARGIWFRIQGPKIEGKALVRDFMYPDDLSDDVVWEEEAQKAAVSSASRPSASTVKTAEYEEAMQYLKGGNAKKDGKKALELLLKSYEKSPDADTAEQIGYVYCSIWATRDLVKAAEWMDKAAEHGSGLGYNKLSMYYSATVKATLQNGEMAIKYAKNAIELIGEEDWTLDTLACAYARNGQFDLAVKKQEEACQEARKQSTGQRLRAFEGRLELYRQGKAFDWSIKF